MSKLVEGIKDRMVAAAREAAPAVVCAFVREGIITVNNSYGKKMLL